MKDVSGRCGIHETQRNLSGCLQSGCAEVGVLMGLGNRWRLAWRLAYLCPLPFLELIELMATQGEVFLHTVHCILCTGILIICSSWFIKEHHKSGHKDNLLQISGCCYKLLDDVFRSQPKSSGPQNIWNTSRRQSVGMADMEDVESHQV